MSATLIQTITEQADQPNDPFAEIPYHTTPNPSQLEVQLAELRAKQQIASRMKSSAMWVLQNVRTHYGPSVNTSVANPNAITFNGSGQIDSTVLDPADVAEVKRAAARFNKHEQSMSALMRQIKKVEKLITAENNAKSAAANGPANSTQLPVGQIPTVIPNGMKGIDNPFFRHSGPATGRYAGHPSGYKFSSQMTTMYNTFNAMLKRHGQSLDKLYVGKVNGCINFVATSTNGKFVWYKYDVGGGSGQNHVILNGNKLKSSGLMALSAVQQDNLLTQYKVV